MKTIILATLIGFSIGLMGTTRVMAAPASGAVIGQAAATTSPITKVPCAWRRVCGVRGCVSRRACW